EAQVAAVSRRLAAVPLAAVYSSDLLRTRRTADLLAAPHGLPPPPLPGVRGGGWVGRGGGPALGARRVRRVDGGRGTVPVSRRREPRAGGVALLGGLRGHRGAARGAARRHR